MPFPSSIALRKFVTLVLVSQVAPSPPPQALARPTHWQGSCICLIVTLRSLLFRLLCPYTTAASPQWRSMPRAGRPAVRWAKTRWRIQRSVIPAVRGRSRRRIAWRGLKSQLVIRCLRRPRLSRSPSACRLAQGRLGRHFRLR